MPRATACCERMVTAGLIDEPRRSAPRPKTSRRCAGRCRLLPRTPPARALRNAPSMHRHQLTIKKRVQEGLEEVAREAAKKLGPKLSVAMILADAETGEILGEVGSSDFFDASRSGWIDMTQDGALAGLDAETLHLRPGHGAGSRRAGDADRGPARRFRRLPAAQFRHGVSGRRERAAGAAALAQRAGGAAARRYRPGAARRRASARSA